jgi:hypothetical protein
MGLVDTPSVPENDRNDTVMMSSDKNSVGPTSTPLPAGY